MVSLAQSGRFANIITETESHVSKEIKFTEEILGLSDNEALVIKAGSNEENELFFDELSGVVHGSDDKLYLHDTK